MQVSDAEVSWNAKEGKLYQVLPGQGIIPGSIYKKYYQVIISSSIYKQYKLKIILDSIFKQHKLMTMIIPLAVSTNNIN